MAEATDSTAAAAVKTGPSFGVGDSVLVQGNIGEVVQGDMAEGDFFLCVRFSDGNTEFVDADELAPLPGPR